MSAVILLTSLRLFMNYFKTVLKRFPNCGRQLLIAKHDFVKNIANIRRF
jgi:hypothetical protein